MKHLITFETDDLKDIDILLSIGNRIGLKSHIETEDENDMELLRKIISDGGDMSYISNPVEWQKNIRKDRDIL